MSSASSAQAAFRSRHADDNGFAPRSGFETFRESDAEQSIVERLTAIAARRGSATALVDGETRLSYCDLVNRATAVGSALACHLDDRPGVVAVQASTTRATIEALLGVLFAGRAYVCLPPSAPDHLLRDITESAVAAVTDANGALSIAPHISRLCLDELRRSRVRESSVRTRPTDLACVFATSGTTGTAKLVGLSHRAVVFDVGRQINDLFLGPDDRIDLLSHGSFSASLSSIFSALLSGAELHIGPVGRVRSLGDWLSDSRITVSTMTVSAFRTLCVSLPRPEVVRDLRLVSLGGETLYDKDVCAFDAAFPASCMLQNAMASTETRTYAQYFVPRGVEFAGPIPIGWPVHQKQVIVVDPDGQTVSEGEEGEMLVVSRFLADGYVNDEQLTAARFDRQPDGASLFRTRDRGRVGPDGCLTFLGRSDTLVKIRGYRVEPEAIERALLADERVRGAAVVRRSASSGEDSLVAFVVSDRARVTEHDIRDPLCDRLPAYAVPSAIHIVTELPLNSNGKVDYQRLAERLTALPPPLIGQLSSSERLAALQASWADALERDSAGPDDDFFALGGDSLQALRLELAVYQRLGRELPLSALVLNPTPRRAAVWLAAMMNSSAENSALVMLHRGGAGPPLFCVPGVGGEPLGYSDLAAQVGHDRPVYGFRATISREPPGSDLKIERIARDYIDDLDAVITPDQPVHLCGHSFGGVVALEMAHQLHARGRRLGLFAIIDTPLGAGRPGLIGTIRDTLANLPNWLWYDALQSSRSELVARIIGKSAEAWRRVRSLVTRTPRDAYPDLRAYFGTRHVPKEVVARVRARLDANRRYVRRPLPGTVVLFRSRAQALMGRSDRCLGWDALAAGVEVFDVPGHHDSCTKPPHVGHLAAKLAKRLRVADSS